MNYSQRDKVKLVNVVQAQMEIHGGNKKNALYRAKVIFLLFLIINNIF